MAIRQYRLPDGRSLPIQADLIDPERIAALGATEVQPSMPDPGALPAAATADLGQLDQIASMGSLEPAQEPQSVMLDAPPLPSRWDLSPEEEAFAAQEAQRRTQDIVGRNPGMPWSPGAKEPAASEPAPPAPPAPPKPQAAAPRQATPQRATGGGGGGGGWVNPMQKKAEEIRQKDSELFVDSLLLQQMKNQADDNLRAAQIEAENEQASRIAEDVERQRLAQQEIERSTQRLQQRVSDTAEEAANMRVDPNKYWSDRSSFARALGALSVAAGSMASNGRNAGKEILDEAINREIQRQEFAVEQAWAANRESRNQFADYLESHGSPKAARENLRAVLYAQMEHERKRQLMTVGADRAQLEGDELIQGMRLARREALLQGEQATLLAQQQAAAAAAAARSRQADDELDPKKRKRVVFSRGKPVGMVTGDKADEAQEALDALDNVTVNLDAMRKLEDETSVAHRMLTPGNTAYRQWQARETDTKFGLNKSYKLGALDESSLVQMGKLVPGAGNTNSYAAMDELQKIIDGKRTQLLQQIVTEDSAELPTVVGATPSGVRAVK